MRVAHLLASQGYEALPRPDGLIDAAKADCQLTTWLVSRFGEHEDAAREIAVTTGSKLTFVFEGRTTTAQPVWRSIARHYWEAINRELGRALPTSPAIAVISSPACDVSDVPWGNL